MNHGIISTDIAQGLKVLGQRLADAKVPSSKLDETLNVATWNIREFGKKRRLDASVHYVAEILGMFDLISVVELRDNLNDLKRVLDILGPYWKAVFSDFNTDAGGNRERIAYVYDERAVRFTGLAAEAEPPRKKAKNDAGELEYLSQITWWRSPFMASFAAGNFDFIVITAHIRWDSNDESSRARELRLLAEWIDNRRAEQFIEDKDIIVMGDFNIASHRDETFKAVTSKGLRVPPPLMTPDGGFGSNLDKNKRYDQILQYPAHPKLYTGKAGIVDFYRGDHKPLFPGKSMTKQEFTYQLSDHLPLWLQLNTDNDSIQLDQILKRDKK